MVYDAIEYILEKTKIFCFLNRINRSHEYKPLFQKKYCDRQDADCPSLSIESKTPSHTIKRRKTPKVPIAVADESVHDSKIPYPSINMDVLLSQKAIKSSH